MFPSPHVWIAAAVSIVGCTAKNPSFGLVEESHASGGEVSEACVPGTRRCECSSKNECDGDLTCIDGICVKTDLQTSGATSDESVADDDDDATGDTESGAPETSTADPGSAATDGPILVNRIFVSSLSYKGNLGGVKEANLACTDMASNAGLAGTWIALISDGALSAKERAPFAGELHNLSGEIVATSTNDLWDGFLENPVAYNERGTYAGDQKVWTGTETNGNASEDCDGWTRSDTNGWALIGSSNQVNYRWTRGSARGHCNNQARLYCISAQ